jgi:hypothetical protein
MRSTQRTDMVKEGKRRVRTPNNQRWAPAIFSLVRFRYLEIVLPLRASPLFSKIC